jgi:DIS3-like exonuclease 1
LDLLEALAINGIIFTQTVLDVIEDEMRSSNRRRLIRRIRALAADKRRESSIFPNEYFSATHYDKLKGQSTKLRRDMAIAKLAGWFVAHNLQAQAFTCPIIMITSIEEVSHYATSLGVRAMTMNEYMAEFRPKSDQILFDSISMVLEEKKKRELEPKNPITDKEAVDPFEKFAPFWSDEALDSGVKSGLLFRGKLQVNKGFANEATVKYKNARGEQETIIIPFQNLRNRAIHGDVVVVAPVDLRRVQATFSRYQNSEGPFGRVVGIETTNWRKYVCTLQLEDSTGSGSSGWLMAVPWDSRIPKIRIKSRQTAEIANSRILVQIDVWDIDSNFPQGHYVKNLGAIGLHETEMQVLLHEYDVDTAAFMPRVLAELPQHNPPSNPWVPNISDPKLGERRDITDWRIYSIDPPGCQDIDDALSYREVNGNIQIGVHIADVTAFVEEGSQLDLEAKARATSVYLTDRRIDMLPTVLSERLCSIRCHETRYAVSVIWEMDRHGKVLDTWFGRTMIKTIYEMCYSDAQDILDNKASAKAKFPDFEELRVELQGLQQVFHQLRNDRSARGALELEGIEVSFQLDGDKKPKKVQTKEALEVHALVAEFMIFANCTVAEFISKHLPESSMLRRHPLPSLSKFKDVMELAASRGIQMDFSSNLTLAQSLHQTSLLGDSMFTLTIRSLTTLALAEAEYISSGSFSSLEYYHYGLAADYYTHFTSPIRRYADVVVHRQLLAILSQQSKVKLTSTIASTSAPSDPKTLSDLVQASITSSGSSSSTLPKQMDSSSVVIIDSPSNHEVQMIADHLNYKNRQSKLVQRDSKELYQNMFFATRENVDAVEAAVVVAFKNTALMLYFPKYGYHAQFPLRPATAAQNSSEPTRFQLDAFPSQRSESADSVSLKSENPAMVTLEAISTSLNKSEMVLRLSSSISHMVRLFDCVTLQIGISESRYHMASIQWKNMRFQTQNYDFVMEALYPASDAVSAAKSAAPSVGPTMTAKSMIRRVLDSEQLARQKMLEQRQRLLPQALLQLWKTSFDGKDAFYRWLQLELSTKSPLSRTDPRRVLASYVLSRRGLQPNFYERSASSATNSPSSTGEAKDRRITRIRQPVCLFSRKPLGRRVFKEAEYKAALEAAWDDYGEEDYREEETAPHPASASIPGLSYGPSNSFGNTHVTTQSQAVRLGEAAAKAEREFKKAQAQVSKSKFASRHY